MATIAIVAAVTHAVLFLGLHLFEPGMNPLSSIISDYSQTAHAGWATAAFVAFGFIWGAMAVVLSAAAESKGVQVGRVLFALAMVAILVAAISPETADPRTGSAVARIQNMVARPGLFLGVLLASVGARRVTGWEAVGGKLVGLATAAIVVLVATIGFLLEMGLGGGGQRILFLILYLWVWTAARQAIEVSKRSEAMSE
jgi:hypothetical protein